MTVTALLLLVAGGIGAFQHRAALPNASENAESYVSLAYIAGGLLFVPLATMSGAASRLVVARRDTRLATLRLVGATSPQVTALAVLDALTQSLAGVMLGIAGYFALIPVIGLIPFDGAGFTFAELVVSPLMLCAVVTGVVLLGTLSALIGLRKVVVSPLGVTKKETQPALKSVRLVAVAIALAGMFAALYSPFASMAAIALMLILGLATLNIVGPFAMSLIGKVWAARARTSSTLLAARRISDDPKTAWRSVGGVALATFIAGLASVMALFGSVDDPEQVTFANDVSTGGYLTLAIAGVLAATSTGVTQAGRVISQRNHYRALHLTGMSIRELNRARLRETTIPLFAAVGLAVSTCVLFMVPVLGAGTFQNTEILARFAISTAFAVGLVYAGATASHGLAKSAAHIS